VSSGVLLAFGDMIQQRIEISYENEDSFDWKRSERMLIVGTVQGPPNHWWYCWLDRVLPGKSMSTVCKKIVADQLIASPLGSGSFFLGVGLLEGRTVPQCWDEYKSKFAMVYLMDWLVWPPSQLINFLFVPNVYRVLYVSTVTVAWNVFMSYAKHYDQRKHTEEVFSDPDLFETR